MPDIEALLRDHIESAAPAVDVRLLARRLAASEAMEERQQHRRVWLATAAGVLAVAAIGVVVLVRPFSGDISQPASSDVAATSTTVVPSTTLAPSTTVSSTTTTASTTTTSSTTTLPPYDGEVPNLEAGWVRQVAGNFGPAAASPELGMVVFDYDGDAWHSPDGVIWTQATGYQPPEGDPPQVINHVAVGPAGFVAAGSSHDGNNTFFSANGQGWEPTAPPTGASAGEVVAGTPGFVVFGSGCPGNAAFSPDGREWRPVPLPAGCYVTGASWTGSHFFAVSSTSDGTVNALLTSEDGETWAESELPGVGAIGTWGVHVAGHGNNLVMLGTDTTASPPPLAAWYSNDGGRTWSESTIEIPEGAPEGEYQAWELIRTDLGYIAVGGIETLTDALPGFVLWSHDGATWSEFIMNDRWFRDVAFTDGGLVGFGDGVWTWTSE